MEDKDTDVWNREARRKVNELWFHWPEHIHKVEKEEEALKRNTKSPGKQKDEACNQDYVIGRQQEVNQWKIVEMRVLLLNQIFGHWQIFPLAWSKATARILINNFGYTKPNFSY